MSTKAQLAQYCADHFPTQFIHSGFQLKTVAISAAISFLVGGLLAWYFKGHGITGVKTDLNNVKTDVENIKNKIFPAAPVGAGTPVASLSN